jgi:hypothetical protein
MYFQKTSHEKFEESREERERERGQMPSKD